MNVHEEMSSDITVRPFTQFIRQTFCKAFHRGLGRVIRGISPESRGEQIYKPRRGNRTYGGLVIPCLDPVLMITAWFSWCSID